MSSSDLKRRETLLIALVRFIDRNHPEGFDAQKMFALIATGQFEEAAEHLNQFSQEEQS